MRESEIRQIFFRISNRYSSFAYDDFKVSDWQDLLQNVPFDRAMGNLRRYSLNPENTFPPHPGILAEMPAQHKTGRDVPNAIETRRMLDEHDRLLSSVQNAAIPESFREAMRKLAARSTYS